MNLNKTGTLDTQNHHVRGHIHVTGVNLHINGLAGLLIVDMVFLDPDLDHLADDLVRLTCGQGVHHHPTEEVTIQL